MSKFSDYGDVKLVKSKRKRSYKGLITVCVCVLAIALVVLLSGVFSGALTVGNFSFLFNKNNEINVKGHSYYLVSMGEYDELSKAENVASGAKLVGASGFIWEKDKKYYIVGNVYKSLDDANKVVSNNTDTNYKMKVLEIKFNNLEIKDKNYTIEQKKSVQSSLDFFNNLYLKCYDYSIKFDKKEISTTFVSSELNTLKSDAKIWASKLDAINSVAVNEKTIHIKNSYISLIDTLENGILKIINGGSANSDIKFLLTEIISIKFKLFQNIY